MTQGCGSGVLNRIAGIGLPMRLLATDAGRTVKVVDQEGTDKPTHPNRLNQHEAAAQLVTSTTAGIGCHCRAEERQRQT